MQFYELKWLWNPYPVAYSYDLRVFYCINKQNERTVPNIHYLKACAHCCVTKGFISRPIFFMKQERCRVI
jgi:hypothetical protein